MECTREPVMRIIAKLKRDINRYLAEWPEAQKRALELVLIHQAELEELLAEEPTFGK